MPQLKPDFESTKKRLMQACESETQGALAEVLDIRQSAVCDAFTRGSIPPSWIITACIKRKVNPEWLVYGTGPKDSNTL